MKTGKLLTIILVMAMIFSLANIFAVSASADDGESKPYSVGENGNWWIGESDTGIKAEAVEPHIAENGNWWVGETDTGIKAKDDADVNDADNADVNDANNADGKNKIVGIYICIAGICMLTSLVALIMYKPYRRWWML